MDKEIKNMDKEIKNYELGFLIGVEEAKNEILEILKRHGSTIINEGGISKIKLAYPVNKENFAVFGDLYFSGEPQKIKELTNDLKASSKILRFFIINRPTAAKDEDLAPVQPQPVLKEREEKEQKERPAKIISAPKPEAGTLSNEELEKKLEEILK